MGDIGRGRSGSAAWGLAGCTLSFYALGVWGGSLIHRKAMSVHFLLINPDYIVFDCKVTVGIWIIIV